MMKKFVNPELRIEKFNFENVITVSGNALDDAVSAVTSEEGGVTLDGKTLTSLEVIKVTL